MMLNGRVAYMYQVASIAFAVSIMLDIRPIAALTLYLILFTGIYTVLASRTLKNLSPKSFPSSIKVIPNPSIVGEEVNVEVGVASSRDGIRAIIRLDLDGLELAKGSRTWSGLLKKGETTFSLSVRSMEPGLKLIGPLRIALMDPLGVIVKEFEVHSKVPIFFLEHDKAPGYPSAYSSSSSPSPGFLREQFVGADYEYRVSCPQQTELPAKMIDWRRTAQRDEEVYVKLYDRLVKGDLVFGIGSGLEIVLPDGSRVDSMIIQVILTEALPHIKEGSRVWLMRWERNKKFTAFLLEKSRVAEVPNIPRIRSMIYVTRALDHEELDLLKDLISKGAVIKLVLINLGTDILKISREKWVQELVDLEAKRLENRVSGLGINYTLTSLEEFNETLRRVLAYRRPI